MPPQIRLFPPSLPLRNFPAVNPPTTGIFDWPFVVGVWIFSGTTQYAQEQETMLRNNLEENVGRIAAPLVSIPFENAGSSLLRMLYFSI